MTKIPYHGPIPPEEEERAAPPPTLKWKSETIQVPKVVQVSSYTMGAHEVRSAIEAWARNRFDLNIRDTVKIELGAALGDVELKVTRHD